MSGGQSETLPAAYVLRQTPSGLWEWGHLESWQTPGIVTWSGRRVPTVSRAIRLAREDQYARERAA